MNPIPLNPHLRFDAYIELIPLSVSHENNRPIHLTHLGKTSLSKGDTFPTITPCRAVFANANLPINRTDVPVQFFLFIYWVPAMSR